ncbi:MAG: ABC transporter substrate-binding protein [Janthinobacterium lividum]
MKTFKCMTLAIAATAALLVSNLGCAATIAAPAPIKQKGVLTFCSDLENPPAEGVASDGVTPDGAAVDIMKALGPAMGVTSHIDNYQFSGIFAALDAGKCDLIIASLGKTPERAQRYWLVDYWRVASGLLVPHGNPENLKTYEDLSGKRVAVLLGSRNASVMKQTSDKLVADGKKPLDIVLLGTNVAAFQDFSLGREDALVSDTVVINYYMSRSHGRFEVGGVPVPPKTWSIAILKTNPELKDAVQAGIDQMNASGAMAELTKKWGITNGVTTCSTQHPCE